MDCTFCKTWFSGFANGIDEMAAGARSDLLNHCARRCADTGVLARYREHYRDVGGNRDRFYSEMERLGGVRGEVIVPGKEYRISFPECFCDLHKTGGVDTPNLCECSRQSILYVGEAIWGKNRFTVMCEGTILSGAPMCCFRVVFQEE